MRNNRIYIICAFICISILLGTAMILHFDSDILWHYKLGEEIIKTGRISLQDTFSWQPNLVWVQHEWLYDIILYGIIKIGDSIGFLLIYTLNMFLTLYIGNKMNKVNNNLLYTIIVTIVIIIIPKNMFNRPSEFSVWVLVLMVYLYNKDIKYKSMIYALVGLFIANFHGGVIITLLAAQMILILIDVVTDYRNSKHIDIKNIIEKLKYTLCFLAATLINPSGILLYKTIFKVSGLETTKFISEWHSLSTNYQLGVLIMLIVISLGYRCKSKDFLKDDNLKIGIIIAFLILGMVSQKGLLLFEYLWIIFGYRYLEEFLDQFFKGYKLNKKAIKIFKTITPALLVFFIFGSYTVLGQSIQPFNTYVNRNVSINILNKLKELKDIKVLHDYNYGNWLIYNDIKCFIDSRQFPYESGLGNNRSLNDYMDAINSHSSKKIKDFIKKYDFDYIVVSDNLDLDWYLENNSNYKLLITDSIEVKNSKDKEKYKTEKLYQRIGDGY